MSFQLVLANPPAHGAPQLSPVKGLIVVFDGSTLRQNSIAYEYSDLRITPNTFKATLPNGKSASGMAGHVVAKLDYERQDIEKMLVDAEKIAALYTKSKPILDVRIPQLRERFNLKLNRNEQTKEVVANAEEAPGKAQKNSLVASAQSKSKTDDILGKTPAEISGSSDADHGARLNAIMEIAMSPKDEDFQRLVLAIQDKDSEIQNWGIRGVGKLKSKQALDKLIEIFKGREIATTKRKYLIKSIGSFTSNLNQELSLSAVDALCEIADEADSDEAIKSEALQQMSVCLSEGKEHIRARIESKNSVAVKNVLSQIKNHETALKKAAEAFTIQDRKLLYIYGLSPKSTASNSIFHSGVAFLSNECRIPYSQPRAYELDDHIENIESDIRNGGGLLGDNYDWLYGLKNRERLDIFKKEHALITSKDPLEIGQAAMLRLKYLNAFLTNNAADNKQPRSLFVDYIDSHTLEYVATGIDYGAMIDMDLKARYELILGETRSLTSMFFALSSTARQQINSKLPDNLQIPLEGRIDIEEFAEILKLDIPYGKAAWRNIGAKCYVTPAGKASVHIVINKGEIGNVIYNALLANKGQIENEIGLKLEWKSHDETQTIHVCREFGDLLDQQNYSNSQRWIEEIGMRFKNTLSPRINKVVTR